MDKIIRLPKGTKDCLPHESYVWQYIEKFLRHKASLYGIKEIRTPMFEYTELFLRGVGDTTDIVQKEMYTFNDKGNRSITLKAEGTAPTIRAFIEHSLSGNVQPTKLFYITPVFRYENVQKGRLRQHHQFGVEIFGSDSPICDAETINLAYSIFEDLHLKDSKVYVNSLGCKECRPSYNNGLVKFLNNNKDNLCKLCQDRLERNPLRVLDCKNTCCKELLKDAPSILDYICGECNDHFENVKKYLDVLGVNFEVNHNIVRGLDYYTRTVFEIVDNSGIALCGGGRYNNLVGELGGKDSPAVGFGMGIERLISALDLEKNHIEDDRLDLFIINYDENFRINILEICNNLRKVGIKCDIDYLGRNLKSQMKYANKINAKNIVVIGQDEINNSKINIKSMDDGKVITVDFDTNSILKYFS